MHSKQNVHFCHKRIVKQILFFYLICGDFKFILLKIVYRKVVSSRLSWLVAHFHIFRLFTKRKFDAYLLCFLAQKVQN